MSSLLSMGLQVLNREEIENIVHGAFQIIERTGIKIENDEMLKHLGEFGGEIDYGARKVVFKKLFMENFIKESHKVVSDNMPVKFITGVDIYEGYYLDPVNDLLKEWTHQRLLDYVKLARSLPNISYITMLGCPVREVPVELQPLYEKLYCWKYGIDGGRSIWTTGLCPKIYDMLEVYAAETGRDIKEIYTGTVYVISPLRLGSVEAEQFMYFYKKGLATRVGLMASVGGTAPVTLAGAISLHLAENLLINIINRAFFGNRTLYIASAMSVLDMSTAAFQFARPEVSIINVAGMQIAKYLGANFSGLCGVTDAKAPGYEAGCQKASSAVLNAAATGVGIIVAGELAVGDISSPVQMILDDEMTDSLKRICSGFEVNEATLALDVIDETGPGGSFLAAEHTALNFRQSLWQPSLWSREMYNVWKDKGRKTDVDRAKEKYFDIMQDGKPLEPQISEETEKMLLKIILEN